MKICLTFASLILSVISAPTVSKLDESPKFIFDIKDIKSYIEMLLNTIEQTEVQGDNLPALLNEHGQEEASIKLMDISQFWKNNAKRIYNLYVFYRKCAENNGFSSPCEGIESSEELDDDLIQYFNEFEVQFEPILNNLQKSAKSEILDNRDPEEIEALQMIIEGTQRIKNLTNLIVSSIVEGK